MKVWISKYALTEGIKEIDAGESTGDGYVSTRVNGWISSLKHGRDVHETKRAAIDAAEVMRTKKIASLEKQIAKLRKMTFE